MKKIVGLLLFVPVLTFSVLLGENNDAGTKAIDNNQEVLAADQLARNLEIWQAVADARQPQAQPQIHTTSKHEWLRAIANNSWTGANSGSTMSLAKGLGVLSMSFTDMAGAPVTGYAIGDTIIATITSADLVTIEFYVDDGDALFDAAADFLVPFDEPLTFQDGDSDDKDPTVGVWSDTLRTGEMGGGDDPNVIFQLQGATIWIHGSTAADAGEVSLLVNPSANATTTISGHVGVGGANAENIIVAAFLKSAMEKEDGPDNMYLALTDASGNYTIALDAPDIGENYVVIAFDPLGNYPGKYPTPMFHEAYLVTGGTAGGLNFILEPGDIPFAGVLADETGTPIPGVRIYLEGDGPSSSVELVTAEDGSFSVNLIAGWWRGHVKAEDLVPTYMVPQGGEFEAYVGMDPVIDTLYAYVTDATISGTVCWSDGITPAPNVEVWVSAAYDQFTRAVTDASGNYTLNVASALDYVSYTDDWGNSVVWEGFWVNPHERDHLAKPSGRNVRISAPSDAVTGQNFELHEVDAWLFGTVTNSFGGAMEWMHLDASTTDETVNFSSWAETGRDGHYRMPLIGGYEYRVNLHTWDMGPIDTLVTIAAGAERELNMVVEIDLGAFSLNSAYDVDNDHGRQVFLVYSINDEALKSQINQIVVLLADNPTNPSQTPVILKSVPNVNYTHSMGIVVETLADGVNHNFFLAGLDEFGNDVGYYTNWQTAQSHDNLPPAVPPYGLVAAPGATPLQATLSWQPAIDDPASTGKSMIKFYSIYRASGTGALVKLGNSATTSFGDNVTTAGSYSYAVSATDFGGNESAKSPGITYTFLGVEAGAELPDVYALGANYPNPFNPSTIITFQLPEAGHMTLQVYDLTGKVVNTLVGEHRPAGYHQVVWNGRDNRGTSLATGVYFYRIVAGQSYTETRKMVLIK